MTCFIISVAPGLALVWLIDAEYSAAYDETLLSASRDHWKWSVIPPYTHFSIYPDAQRTAAVETCSCQQFAPVGLNSVLAERLTIHCESRSLIQDLTKCLVAQTFYVRDSSLGMFQKLFGNRPNFKGTESELRKMSLPSIGLLIQEAYQEPLATGSFRREVALKQVYRVAWLDLPRDDFQPEE
ncbi:hypothetical protein Plhal710r2_c043g0144511 [Plasmopara halstedii]